MNRAGLGSIALLVACSAPAARPGDIVVTEVVSVNLGGGPGAARDEHGDYDDWIELHNTSEGTVDLRGLQVSDFLMNPTRYRLPEDESIPIEGGGYLLLFADGEAHQGPTHLPFKLSKDGEQLSVRTSTGAPIAALTLPAMRAGESYASGGSAGFVVCARPTPGAANDCSREPSVTPQSYAPYEWPEVWPPAVDAPVVISELHPAEGWLELHNRSGGPVNLNDLSLWLTMPPVSGPLPDARSGGQPIALEGALQPGEYAVVQAVLPATATLVLGGPQDALYDRVVYRNALGVYALPNDGAGLRRRCDASSATPGERNGACAPAPERPSAPTHLAAIRGEQDFSRLSVAGGDRAWGARSVKWVYDRETERMYFTNSARFRLHFDFVWEVLQGQPAFDMCEPEQRRQHSAEWGRFSQQNYFSVDGRRYYLGTLIQYPGAGLDTVEFAAGDRISPQMLREAFFEVAARVHNGRALMMRPNTERFEETVLEVEGELPLVPIDRPFSAVDFQALNPGLGYGVLQRVRAEEIEEAPLSYQSIAIIDQLPNDVPPLSGTITEAFQTPLAHVNVLAQNRGTPNMALKDASQDPRIAPLIGELVRFEVTQEGFTLSVATATEAEAFWAMQRESRPRFVPPKDAGPRGLINLQGASIQEVPVVGAKAAQLAELMNMSWPRWSGGVFGSCSRTSVQTRLPVPRPAFAVPFSHYLEHLERSGAKAAIEALLVDEEAQANPVLRKEALEEIRRLIKQTPADPQLVSDLSREIEGSFGQARVRLRSSTNVEDLAGFNGAGLYESASAQIGSSARPVEGALLRVWASAWRFRAFEERALFGVEQEEVAMGVLVHRGFPAEEANGVVITKNVINPASSGIYINAQVGEVSIVNPQTGHLPEQLLFKEFNPPEVVVLQRSTLTEGEPVLGPRELDRLACALRAIHNRFRDHYRDVIPSDRFAVDAEFKLDGPQRELFIKQARPWIQPQTVTTQCSP